MASLNVVNSKSFDLRMSKKVAELTQVVHLLFVRSHEKEVELEALKDAYEYEIDVVIADAKNRIATETKRFIESDNTRKECEDLWKDKEADYVARIQMLERNLLVEMSERQKLCDHLSRLKNEIEAVRQHQKEEKDKYAKEIEELRIENGRIRSRMIELENDLETFNIKSVETAQEDNSQTTMLETAHEQLQTEHAQLKEISEKQRIENGILLARIKQLDEEIKNLRNTIFANARNKEQQRSWMANNEDTVTREETQQRLRIQAEEIELLRKQLQSFRMELSNRETNFNRRFTDVQPVILRARRNSGQRPPPSSSTVASVDGVNKVKVPGSLRSSLSNQDTNMTSYDVTETNIVPASSSYQLLESTVSSASSTTELGRWKQNFNSNTALIPPLPVPVAPSKTKRQT